MTDDYLSRLIAERNGGMPRWRLAPALETHTGQGYAVDPPRSVRLVHDAEPVEEAPSLSKSEYLIEEVEHLLLTDTADSIARRLGYAHSGSLARVLRRLGRSDLAQYFLANQSRRAS